MYIRKEICEIFNDIKIEFNVNGKMNAENDNDAKSVRNSFSKVMIWWSEVFLIFFIEVDWSTALAFICAAVR